MRSKDNWRRISRFSIRKLSIGVVSATIGASILGASLTSQPALANESTDLACQLVQDGAVHVDYQYVNEKDLTAEQRALLQSPDQFVKETAGKNATYILVYQAKRGLLTLPSTGELPSGLLTLLGASALTGVIFVVNRRRSQVGLTVLLVTSAAGLALSSGQVSALEQGLTSFLTQTYTVAYGHQLPQPAQVIGELEFVGYLVIPSEECLPVQPAVVEQPVQSEPAPVVEDVAPVQPVAEEVVTPAQPVVETPVPTQPQVVEVVTPAPPVTEVVEVVTPTQPVVETVEVVKPAEPVVEVIEVVKPAEPVVEVIEVVTQPEPVVEVIEVVKPAEPVVENGEVVTPTEPVVEVIEVVKPAEPVVEVIEVVTQPEPVVEVIEVVKPAEPVVEVVEVVTPTEPVTEEVVVTPPVVEETPEPEVPVTQNGPDDGIVTTEDEKPEFPLDQVKTEPVQFETVSTPDDNLWDDETVVDVPGQAGSVSYIVLDDVRQVLAETAPVTQEQRVGTKPVNDLLTKIREEEVDFEVIIDIDPERLADLPDEIVQEGVKGILTITEVYRTVRGEAVGEPISRDEKVAREVQNQIIKRGSKVLTQADLNDPTTIKQMVNAGEIPDPQASIDTNSVTRVATYTWKTQPDTSTGGENIPGVVLVTYDDNSVDEVPVVIDVIAKTKPILTLVNLVEQDDDRKITLNYDLEDPTNAYVSAKIEIYDGERLVKSQSVDSFDDFDVTDLDWFVPYTLKTTLVYDLGNGQETELLKEEPFELSYKRVEIKHVDHVELYEKQADGSYRLTEELPSNITDFSRYYAKVVDDKQKDIYLALTASEETTVDGKPVFKVTATAPQLIEYSGQGRDNKDNYQFFVPKTQVYTDGKIRSFDDLVKAMRANPAGVYELGDDLDATKFALAGDAASYIPENFSGRLIGNNHHIKGLKAPLFSNLTGAFDVKDLALTEVNINMPNATNIGALAKETNGIAGQSKVTNVAVQGSIVANRFAGGLVFLGRNTAFENVSFDGNLTTTNGWQINISGGLVGYLRNASSIDKGRVNANITVDANQNPGSFHIGMIAGSVGENGGGFTTPITNVVASGSLTNKSATEARIGGLVGSLTTTSRLSNAVSDAVVTNGQPLVGAKLTPGTQEPDANVVKLDESAPSSAIADKAAEMGITVAVDNFIRPDINKYDVDYSKVAGYQPDHLLRYQNLEKLLPFYNKEFIVRQAQLMPEGKLTTTPIVSVVPMAGNEIIADYAGRKADINKLLVRYADGSVDYLDLAYKEDFRDTAIAEYTVAGTDLLYTPNQLTTSYKDTVSKVLPALSGLTYYDESLLKAMNKDTAGSSVKELMDKLYLKDSFNHVMANLENFLAEALATSNVLTTKDHDLAQYILDNKEALVLGMAYVNKWYNFNFENLSAKDLLLSYQDFYGNKADSLEWLIGLGRQGYDALNPVNNVTTYASQFAPYTGSKDLVSYLSDNRKSLTSYATDNDWFKATSKAYIAEGPSKVLPNQDVTAFSLLSTPSQQNGILPLLTTRGETFMITNMGGITYGMYDRYYNFDKVRAAATQEEKEAVIKDMVDQAAIWQRDHFDFWYRNAPENVRDRLIKPMVTWDGYQIPNGGPWLPMFGDDTRPAILDFFGPIGSRAHFVNNGAGAVANGSTIYFMFNQVLNQYGSSVFTHEAVHNNDGSIYLGGFGRRFGQRAELFATGLLQVPTEHKSTDFGINTMYDYAALGYTDADNRYHALSPERFQTSADLEEFYKRTFDVLYTLDYAEAEVVLKNMTPEQQSVYFNKVENYHVNDVGTGAQTHAGNVVRRFTADEWAKLNIKTVNDLIDNDTLTHREYAIRVNNTESRYDRNGYYMAQMFSPIYSALSNDTGAPGDLMFRRIAFELLAEKGYENGFIPYTSDKLANIAKERGSTGTETWGGTRTVGNVTDKVVLDVVFGGKYATWADFKKDMFRQRIEKVGSLKPVTITYKDQNITLSSYADIENLLKEALEEDIRRFGVGAQSPSDANNRNYANDSRVKEVKAKIYNAYLRQTDDFRASIYR